MAFYQNKSPHLKEVKEVYYHAGCPDGTSSAMICALAFNDRDENDFPKFRSVSYGEKWYEEMEPKKWQLFVDITPPKNRWEEWKSYKPIVLDHHQSAKYIVDGLEGVYGNENESGAVLAFKHVYKPLKEFKNKHRYKSYDQNGETDRVANFAELNSIRDTWNKKSPRWGEASELACGLSMYEARKLIDDALRGEFKFESMQEIGKVILDNRMRKGRAILKSNKIHEINGKKIIVFNTFDGATSEICDVLNDGGIDIAVGYFYSHRDKDCIQVSLRSKVKINHIAEAFGGGGHENAAGFRITSDEITPSKILNMIKEKLE